MKWRVGYALTNPQGDAETRRKINAHDLNPWLRGGTVLFSLVVVVVIGAVAVGYSLWREP